MPVQKFRARMKAGKYNPETDPEMMDDFGEYFTKAASEEEGRSYRGREVGSYRGRGVGSYRGRKVGPTGGREVIQGAGERVSQNVIVSMRIFFFFLRLSIRVREGIPR